MRLRVFDRLRGLFRRHARSADTGLDEVAVFRGGGHRKQSSASRWPPSAGASPAVSTGPRDVSRYPESGVHPAAGVPGPGGGGAAAESARSAGGGGAGRARIREAPLGSAPVAAAPRATPGARAAQRQPWYQVIGPPVPTRQPGYPPALAHEMSASGPAAVAPPATVTPPATARPGTPDPRQARLPFTPAHPEGAPAAPGDGRANCGPLEKILWRQWEDSATPHPAAVAAVERLASFPRALQEKLANGLTGIYVGAGGVPELDHMTELRGVPLPSGKATWDACAGAYGERKIVVGTRPSPTPDVVCHEVGHALDDLDSPPGRWQSDSAEFSLIYDQCRSYLASDFHRQRGGLGRKEFFADSFAAIASGQRPALVDMLSGNTRAALRVMLYFNRRYGI